MKDTNTKKSTTPSSAPKKKNSLTRTIITSAIFLLLMQLFGPLPVLLGAGGAYFIIPKIRNKIPAGWIMTAYYVVSIICTLIFYVLIGMLFSRMGLV